jgi:hypothetical protein
MKTPSAHTPQQEDCSEAFGPDALLRVRSPVSGTGSTCGIVHSWTGSASCPPLLEGLTTAAERTCIPTSADKLGVGQPARRSCLLVQEALPRAAGHGAQIRTMPGTCQLATALTSKSEEKACLTISPARVHRTEAESAFLSRMKCSTGLTSSMYRRSGCPKQTPGCYVRTDAAAA